MLLRYEIATSHDTPTLVKLGAEFQLDLLSHTMDGKI
jgi:hypothetical protein